MELPLEIGQGDIKIPHGHLRDHMTEEFHDGGEAHAGTKHFRPVCVAELMRDDADGQAAA